MKKRKCSEYKDHIKLFKRIISSNEKFNSEEMAERIVYDYFNQFKLLQKVINCSMKQISISKLSKNNIYFEINFKNTNAKDSFVNHIDLLSFPFFGKVYNPYITEIDEHIISLCFE